MIPGNEGIGGSNSKEEEEAGGEEGGEKGEGGKEEEQEEHNLIAHNRSDQIRSEQITPDKTRAMTQHWKHGRSGESPEAESEPRQIDQCYSSIRDQVGSLGTVE